MSEVKNGMEDRTLKIKESDLSDLTNINGIKLCGKIMKRFEIIQDKETLKKEVKELIYESFRDHRDNLVSLGHGIEKKVFKFNRTQ